MATPGQWLPGGGTVLAGVVGDLALMGTVGAHREDLLVAVTIAVEGDQLAVGGEVRVQGRPSCRCR